MGKLEQKETDPFLRNDMTKTVDPQRSFSKDFVLAPTIYYSARINCVTSIYIYINIKRKEVRPGMGLMPVIATLWEAKVGGSPEVRHVRPGCPTWQNPISTKNTKISRSGGACL